MVLSRGPDSDSDGCDFVDCSDDDVAGNDYGGTHEMRGGDWNRASGSVSVVSLSDSGSDCERRSENTYTPDAYTASSSSSSQKSDGRGDSDFEYFE